MKIEEYKQIIDEHILDYIPSIDKKSEVLYESMKYSLLTNGKRIRPIFLLASNDFCGGEITEALPYAISVEYIHTYSLIHDDLPSMDNDDLRRGQKTNHIVFGESIAILTGDALLNTAYEIMIKNVLSHIDKKKDLNRFINAENQIAKGAGVSGMITGQVADIESTDKNIAEEMIYFIHLNKTAALIKASILAGFYLGGASQELIHAFDIYGEEIGLAFQIVDDILDYEENPNEVSYSALFGIKKSKERAVERTKIAINAIKDFSQENTFFIDFAKKLLERIN